MLTQSNSTKLPPYSPNIPQKGRPNPISLAQKTLEVVFTTRAHSYPAISLLNTPHKRKCHSVSTVLSIGIVLTYTSIHIRQYIHINTYTSIHIHQYIHINTYTSIHIHLYIDIFTYTSLHIHQYIHINKYTSLHIHLSISTYTSIYSSSLFICLCMLPDTPIFESLDDVALLSSDFSLQQICPNSCLMVRNSLKDRFIHPFRNVLLS